MPEESLIARTATRILSDLADPQDAETGAPGAWRAQLWPALEGAGLTSAWAAEARGGAGAELSDGFDILRAAGRGAAPGPLAETLLAALVLSRAGLDIPAGPLTVAPLRAGDALRLDGAGRVSGRLRAVPFAAEAGELIALALDPQGRTHALRLDPAEGRPRPRDVDLGHARADLRFADCMPRGAAPSPGMDLERLRALGAVARVQQIAGALEGALQLSADYVQERVAFGRALAKFQAVQQNLARLAGETAAALTAASSAADALRGAEAGEDVSADDLLLEVAAAKIRAGEAAAEAAAIAHQVHGAIGFTAEYRLQRFTRPLRAWRDDFGAEAHWALTLGRRAAAAGPQALWPALTRR